jgi:NhaA family Na+:H+ antiporter
VPLGPAIWALLYNGGIHATVAGVAMGLILRTVRDQDEKESPRTANSPSPARPSASTSRPPS